MSDTTTSETIGDTIAKFYVSKIELWPGQGGGKVIMTPVSRGSRNAGWAAATPSGTIELVINNPAAFEQFAKSIHHDAGCEFHVRFEHAPQAHAGDGHTFEETPAGHYNAGRCAECGSGEAEHVAAG